VNHDAGNHENNKNENKKSDFKSLPPRELNNSYENDVFDSSLNIDERDVGPHSATLQLQNINKLKDISQEYDDTQSTIKSIETELTKVRTEINTIKTFYEKIYKTQSINKGFAPTMIKCLDALEEKEKTDREADLFIYDSADFTDLDDKLSKTNDDIRMAIKDFREKCDILDKHQHHKAGFGYNFFEKFISLEPDLKEECDESKKTLLHLLLSKNALLNEKKAKLDNLFSNVSKRDNSLMAKLLGEDFTIFLNEILANTVGLPAILQTQIGSVVKFFINDLVPVLSPIILGLGLSYFAIAFFPSLKEPITQMLEKVKNIVPAY
jgi:predicted  nucleic acid-binding Zn-ribbon protein